MAITHNLATASNNLSGYDPVEGESDGTTIGKNYIVWQIFQGLKAFDSNVEMISGSGATPDWLAPASGNMMVAPAKNSNTTHKYVNWYYKNDPGLSGSIPNVWMYEWGTGTVASNYNKLSVGIKHIISGSAAYRPFASGSIVDNTAAGFTSTYTKTVAYLANFTTTTTTMANIPKVIFWKSNNLNSMMAINKADGVYYGYFNWYTPTYTGYRASLSGSFTQGTNMNAIAFTNGDTGNTWVEGFTQQYGTSLTAQVNGMSVVTSAGTMPTIKFNMGTDLSLITGKIRIGLGGETAYFKAISDEIEGLFYCNVAAVGDLAGTIIFLNSKYYLVLNTLDCSDTGNEYLVRALLELGT